MEPLVSITSGYEVSCLEEGPPKMPLHEPRMQHFATEGALRLSKMYMHWVRDSAHQ